MGLCEVHRGLSSPDTIPSYAAIRYTGVGMSPNV